MLLLALLAFALEAAAHGVPVVSTRIGAEGLDLAPEREVLLRDDPEGLAQACARVLADDALATRLGLEYDDTREFATAAGFVLAVLKKLPAEGEHFTQQGWRFEVVDMDGLRIDKVLITRL